MTSTLTAVDAVTSEECEQLLTHVIIGRSPAIQQVTALVRQVAHYPDTTVLLQGESGTGKDVVASAIHAISNRAAHSFVPINCAAIPETLLESELFGVEMGAFTDAKESRAGHLLRAHQGTLFLDEIGSMPMILQAKLLRFLETRRFHRVGSTKEQQVDLRVISATNIDLQAAVTQHLFRNDLFYRLNVVTIHLPPLRERMEDIELLVEHFLSKLRAASGEPLHISSEAMQYLLRYSWPGNIRQLWSVLQLGQIMCNNHLILPKDLPVEVRAASSNESLRLEEVRQQLHLPHEGVNLPDFLRTIEKTFMQEALAHCQGNQVHAAALLHISRDQLRYRLFNKQSM